eukprot:Rhum_TRINITY_DN15125_c10_g2::Rhum_TRINITY_DN15125_c10_g2_i1::g.138202::m.138202
MASGWDAPAPVVGGPAAAGGARRDVERRRRRRRSSSTSDSSFRSRSRSRTPPRRRDDRRRYDSRDRDGRDDRRDNRRDDRSRDYYRRDDYDERRGGQQQPYYQQQPHYQQQQQQYPPRSNHLPQQHLNVPNGSRPDAKAAVSFVPPTGGDLLALLKVIRFVVASQMSKYLEVYFKGDMSEFKRVCETIVAKCYVAEEEHPAVFESQRLQRNIVLYVDGYMGRHYRGKGVRQR